MSTVPKSTSATNPAPRPATTYKTAGSAFQPKGDQTFLFDKENYMWMFGGLALILIGFVLMAGGKSPDPHAFNYDEIYSFRRITLAPIVILLGFGVEVYAIMKKPKETSEIQ